MKMTKQIEAPKTAPKPRANQPKTVVNSFAYQTRLAKVGVALTASGAWLERRLNTEAITRLKETAKALGDSHSAFLKRLKAGEQGVLILSNKQATLLRRATSLGDGLYHFGDKGAPRLLSTDVFTHQVTEFVTGPVLLHRLIKTGIGCKVMFKTAKEEATGIVLGALKDFNSLVLKNGDGWDLRDFELKTNRFNKTTRAALVAEGLPIKKMLPA